MEINTVSTELKPTKHDLKSVFFCAVLLFLYFWIPSDPVSYVYTAGEGDTGRLQMHG